MKRNVPIKEKRSTVENIQLYNLFTVIPHGLRLERLKVANGGQNTGGAAFRIHCLDTGIKFDFASTNTPQHIGGNGRLRRTLAGMGRCMLSDPGLLHFRLGAVGEDSS